MEHSDERAGSLELSAIPSTIAFKKWKSRSCKVVRRLIVSNPAPGPFVQACFIQGPKTRRFKLYFASCAPGDAAVSFDSDALHPFVIGPKKSLSLKVAFAAPTGDDPDYLFSDFQDTVTVHTKESTISILLYAVREKENDEDGFQPSSTSLQSRTLPRPHSSSLAELLLRGDNEGRAHPEDADEGEEEREGQKEEGNDAQGEKENGRIFDANTAVSKSKVVALEEKATEATIVQQRGQEEQMQPKEEQLVDTQQLQDPELEDSDRPQSSSSAAASEVSDTFQGKERVLPAALRALLAPVDSSEDAMSIIAKMRAGRGRPSETGCKDHSGSDFASFDALVRKATTKGASATKEAVSLSSSSRLSSNVEKATVPTTDEEAAFYKSFIKEQKMKTLRAEYGEAAEDVYRALNDVEKRKETSVEVKAKDAAKAARKRLKMRDDAFRKTNAIAARMCDIARGKRLQRVSSGTRKGGAKSVGKEGEEGEETGAAIDWNAMKQNLQAYEHEEHQLDTLALPLNSPRTVAAVTDEAKEDDLSWFLSQVVKK